MSAPGFTPISLYYSTTASAAPSAGNLANGELALNITDGRLFYKDNGGVVQVLATKGAGTIGGSNTQVQYNSSGALAGSANLTFDGTTLTAAGLAGPHNGTVGATTPNTGAFTTLSASSTVTLSGGTANGVAYLNGSKVLTTGSALTFDGTNLGLGVTPSAWATFKVMQIGNGTADTFIAVSGNQGDFGVNAYYNAGWKYQTSSVAASRYEQSSGVHQWFTAPSGTAGTAITFTQAMTLDASGNWYLGATGGARGGATTKALIKLAAGSPGQAYLELQAHSTTQTDSALLFSDGATGAYGALGYDHNADAMLFQVNSAERARIDSSGKVAIGTTDTTNAKVTVYSGSASTGNSLFLTNIDGIYNPYLFVQHLGVNGVKLLNSSSFGGTAGNLTIEPAGNLIFSPGATERARIDSSGNLIVNNGGAGDPYIKLNSASGQIWSVSNNAANTGVSFYSSQSRSADLGRQHIYCLSNGSLVFQVYGNGNTQNLNNSYGAVSDIKLKTEIVDATPKLEKLMQVRVRQYELKATPGHKQLGVIAQELEEVFPGMIEENKDRDESGEFTGETTKSVKYSVFVPMLIKAIQEQQAIINQLKSRLDAANL